MIRTLESIMDQLRNSLSETNSELADFPEFGNLYSIFRAVSATVLEQDVKLDNLTSNLFLTTATGNSLDAKAKEFNISRKTGTASVGGIICLGLSSNIPFETILTEKITGLQYVTTERIIINNNARSLGSIKCLEFTSTGNLKAGTELFSSLFPNIKFIVGTNYDVFNSTYRGNLSGGSPREDDSALKTRVLDTLKTLSLSTTQALKLAALNITGITKVSLLENVPGLGYITVYVNTPQSNIINIVTKQLNLIKPVGVALIVKTFITVPINIDITITSFNSNNNNNNTELLKSNIVTALQNYITSLNQMDTLTREALAASVLRLPNITNITVNTPASNIFINANEILTLNNVNISYTN